MVASIDWHRLRVGTTGPERAFEAFAAQLFERWVRRTYGPRVKSYTLRGDGGDGGVEVFALLDNQDVVGLQAKWFPNVLGDAQFRQIQRSINTAVASYPGLKTYFVALPQNLTKGKSVAGKLKTTKTERRGNERRQPKGGVERWNDLQEATQQQKPELVLQRWDESGLLGELSLPENHELRAVWFSGELSLDSVRVAWKRSESRLSQRYLPQLHAVGQFEETLSSDLWAESWVRSAIEHIDICNESMTSAILFIKDYAKLHSGSSKKRYIANADDVIKLLTRAVDWIADLKGAISLVPMGPVTSPPGEIAVKLERERFSVASEKESGDSCLANDRYVDWISRVHQDFTSLSRLAKTASESRALRVVAGPAGCGKTHAAANTVRTCVESGIPALFVQAKDAEESQRIGGLLRDALDKPDWPWTRILDALESLAILSVLSPVVGSRRSARAVIVIDGLDESTRAPEWWAEALRELDAELKSRPRVHAVVTLRPEMLSRVRVAGFSLLTLNDNGNLDIGALTDAYAAKYGVGISSVPWLRRALRSPLEVRLLAEEFESKHIAPEVGAATNLLSLFQRKMVRVEREARQRAGSSRWSDDLPLAERVLEFISDLTIGVTPPYIQDNDLLDRLCDIEQEFTADRVRVALSVLQEHGLLDKLPGSVVHVLGGKRWAFGLSHRHISDYVIARQAARTLVSALDEESRVRLPAELACRPGATILCFAMLAERGHFATSDIWLERPEDLELLYVSALALVPIVTAEERTNEVHQLLTRSTALNREVIDRLILPVSRVPHHPLGSTRLDEALRSLPLSVRDQLWSVPDDLEGTGIWVGNGNVVLDRVHVDCDSDVWNGVPLIAAWTCSTVVEVRRRRAREMLAAWGARNLEQMAQLLPHMAAVDDQQVVEDIVVAALGACLGAGIDDSALVPLASLVDRLFFAESAVAWTANVVVRTAARTIVERAALAHPELVSELVDRARPPYPPRGPTWPPLDAEELASFTEYGGDVVNGDLSWYCARSCFDSFAKPANEPHSFEMSIDSGLVDAIADGYISAPEPIVAELEKERVADEIYADNVEEVLSRRIVIEATLASDDVLVGALPDQLSECKAEANEGEKGSRHSGEYLKMIGHYPKCSNPTALRNAMIAHIVRKIGWTADAFSRRSDEQPHSTVDAAIARQHMPASHGSRSSVCRFREKYVWSAINCVAGELADRLPIWSAERDEWARATSYEDIGNDMPDPLLICPPSKSSSASKCWVLPKDALPTLFVEEEDLVVRANRWIAEAPLPDPRSLLAGTMPEGAAGTVLSFGVIRKDHQLCVNQNCWGRLFGVSGSDLELLRRDAPYLSLKIEDMASRIPKGTYASPSIVSWAPWIEWTDEQSRYKTFDASAALRDVILHPMLGAFTARFEGEWPQEPEVWMPSPGLARALGVVGIVGDRYARTYVNRSGIEVAVESDSRVNVEASDDHYLIVESSSLRQHLVAQDLVPVWSVGVYRHVGNSLLTRDGNVAAPKGLKQLSRTVKWLVIEEAAGCLRVLQLRDETDAAQVMPDRTAVSSASATQPG